MELDAILTDVESLGGVTGAYVCDPSGALLAGRGGRLTSREVEAACRAATQAFLCLRSLGESPDEMDLAFAGGRVIVRPAGPGAGLLVVCQPSLNALMLRLRTTVAVRAIAEERESAARAAASPRLGTLVRDLLEAARGARAGKFVTLAAAAGESPEKLAAAGSEAVRFAKLFLGKEKAVALESQLRSTLGREI